MIAAQPQAASTSLALQQRSNHRVQVAVDSRSVTLPRKRRSAAGGSA